MTHSVVFQNATSSNLGVELIYAIRDRVFFVRNTESPSPNGTAATSKVTITQSPATGAITRLNLAEDHEVVNQIRVNQGLISLLEKWIAAYPEEPDPDLEEQKREFDKDRLSRRWLF